MIDENIKAYEETKEEFFENKFRRHDRYIKAYRMKTIVSGNMLECEVYPVFKGGRRKGVAKPKGESREVQKNLNQKNLVKRVIRLVNANFSEKDIWITVGYRGGSVPKSAEEARRDVVNYIRRLQREAEKRGWSEIKYVYVTEFDADKQMHHHVIMNFPDRDLAEAKWGKGEYPQARRLKPNDFGLEGLARYIAKDPKGSKSYGYSLNLHKSWKHATVADGKLTRRHIERIAAGQLSAEKTFEALYEGYEFKDIEAPFSDFVGDHYLYVRMRRR